MVKYNQFYNDICHDNHTNFIFFPFKIIFMCIKNISKPVVGFNYVHPISRTVALKYIISLLYFTYYIDVYMLLLKIIEKRLVKTKCSIYMLDV